MKAIDTAADELQQPAADPGREPDATARPGARKKPSAAQLTTWLLDGRFFTAGPTGNVTSWSPGAAAAFGWGRKEILGEPLNETLAPSVQLGGYSGGVTITTPGNQALRAELAFVPIELAVGYEFNSLLQDISARSTDADALSQFAKSSREMTYGLIDRAWGGAHKEPAGWLVVFQVDGAAAEAPGGDEAAQPVRAEADPSVADNVVSIADAAGGEEARAQLERARRDADDARVEIRSLEGQLEEARREAQRARQEVDVARQEAGDSRDALTVAERDVQQTKHQLEEARRQTDEVRAAAEEARIRSEEAQREAESLREQLREVREGRLAMAGRTDGELAAAKEREAELERSIAEIRAEAARHEAEVAPLRERYQAAQRDVGALRADLESARAEAAERETLSERRAAELERARQEFESRRAEVEARLEERSAEVAELHVELERTKAEAASTAALDASTEVSNAGADAELAAVKQRLERMRLAFDRAPVASALIAPDGRYVEVSDTLCETLGHGRDQLLSGAPPAIVHPDDADAHRDLARRLLAGEQASSRVLRRYVHADGKPLAMRESVTLVRDGEGRPTMFVLQLEEAHEQAEHVVMDACVEPDEPPTAERVGPALSTDVMRRAFEDDLFDLHCQPLVDLRTNDVTQYELLIRMRGEDGRLILPEAFLGPARRAGLAHAIDRWVVRQAVRLLVGNEHVSLEVNLSPEAVHDAELPAMIEEELAGASLDPARLVFEVASNTAADNLEETRALAKRLRGLGCRFALDDFRSNFGSFRLVRELPLDYLKLDGELVGSLTESRTSQLIVKALVDVAAGTGMSTVAVFVSDEETLKLLRQLGVDYAQGYVVGRPRPLGEVLRTDDPRQLPSG